MSWYGNDRLDVRRWTMMMMVMIMMMIEHVHTNTHTHTHRQTDRRQPVKTDILITYITYKCPDGGRTGVECHGSAMMIL